MFRGGGGCDIRRRGHGKGDSLFDVFSRLRRRLLRGAPAVKKHGEGAFNPGRKPQRSAGGCQWNDPPYIAARLEALVGGGQSRWRGNFPAYALDRWGSRIPKTRFRALVVGGGEQSRVMGWLAEIPGLAGITLVRDAEEDDLAEDFTALGMPIEETGWDGLAANGAHHLAAADYALSRRADLAACLERIDGALASGGLLAVRDYTGPGRYQFSEGQMRIVNAILPLLPEKWRRDVSGQALETQEPPPLAWVMANDPAAAVAAEEVRAAVTAGFALVEEADLGGTILMPLLAGISHNFLDPAPECLALLETLWSTERALIAAGLLSSDHWFAVAGKQSGKTGGRAGDGTFIDRGPMP